MENKYHILYVDDDEDNLLVFKSYFRRFYQVSTALDAKTALEILREQHVDLVISDQRMPGMTGVELFEAIRSHFPDIIRIILTAYSDLQAVIDAINKGKIYHFAAKPWDPGELKIILDNALESYTLKLLNRRLVEENMELLLKAERQEKANIMTQFELLKSKINPHFLFNSLNILAALIPEDPVRAVEFTNRFSKLYRGLLELHEQPIITLEQELEFAHSYLYLQKMRFSDSLHVQIDTADDPQHYCLPPFTLQILLENAIKHNVVAEKQPLHIRIEQRGDELAVANTLQLRGKDVASTGTGLAILKSRYELITPKKVELEQTGGEFIARVPLIEES
ncbi:MAG: histidine kinase [Saprospiraceae bacterium]|nr:histidine kinase [Saprospiraceae bacterium]